MNKSPTKSELNLTHEHVCALLHMKLVCFQATPTHVTPGVFVVLAYEPKSSPDPLHESLHDGLFIAVRHFISGFYSMPTRAQQ